MKNKILIIGQAPPNVNQELPYDTTMLYDWLDEVGIDKQEAQDIFEFDAVYDEFPGFSKSGSHLKPSESQMNDYWNKSLRMKVEDASSILVLGSCARDFLKDKLEDKKVEFVIHPSRRNYGIYQKRKNNIISKIKSLTTKSKS